MQILYLLGEMRSNGEEEGRLALFSPCFPSFAEPKFGSRIPFLFGNWKYFQISQRVSIHLDFFLFECSVCIVFLLGTVQLNFIFLSFILVFFAITS